MTVTCKQCRFWWPANDGTTTVDGSEIGLCTRRAPTMTGNMQLQKRGIGQFTLAMATWPRTAQDWRCGEAEEVGSAGGDAGIFKARLRDWLDEL